MVNIWFGIIYYNYKNTIQYLSLNERRVFILVSILYPIIETIYKFIIIYELCDLNYVIFNILEHLVFSFCLTLEFFYIFKNQISKDIILYINILGVVNLIGIINEISQFVLRISTIVITASHYSDTIKDCIINLLGASFAILVIHIFKKK